MLKASINARTWANTTAEAMRHRADRGQGAVEYMGIIVVVVAIILVLMQTNFGSAIAGAIQNQINSITGG
ncbi:hypothetical protein ACPXCE_05845 [Streptomyces sp. DT24]|uniref:hypothetical protein n=1 Tax=unclassified Streptomyces TaxID=2593676 RepID=UPI0023B88BBD|nr:hypothetical protein [Streptomyces sp. AM 4-1-1]WEH35611.1 hypothetical protein PZB75_20990 [Streptomyces sp. AM 4-1-1]